MAGVPSIMQAMLDAVAPSLRTGKVMLSVTLDAGGLPEGIYGSALGAVQKELPGVVIGSYPSFGPGGFTNSIVVRAREPERLAEGKARVEAMIADLVAKRDAIPL